jgi:hypothetical protein
VDAASSEGNGGFVAAGPCFLCGRIFTFAPDLVPSVPIDPETDLPPDLGGDASRAISQPLCEQCVALVNPKRVALGLEPIPVLPGAYDVQVRW